MTTLFTHFTDGNGRNIEQFSHASDKAESRMLSDSGVHLL